MEEKKIEFKKIESIYSCKSDYTDSNLKRKNKNR